MKSRIRSQHTDLSAIREATAVLSDLRRMLGQSTVGKIILWVDDHPSNNDIPRRLLEDTGASVVLAQTTDEAVSILESQTDGFDLVISDMGRGENLTAGLELLNYLHHTVVGLPAIIYSDSPEAHARREEIGRLGAIGPILGPKNLIAEVSHLFQ